MGSSQLGVMQQSVISEMANIGLGHATTAIAAMTAKPFNMEVPSVDQFALEELPFQIGSINDPTVGIYMRVEGDLRGHIAFLFSWEGAQTLLTMLLGEAPDSPEDMTDLSASAMLEMGNILNGSFLNAIGEDAEPTAKDKAAFDRAMAGSMANQSTGAPCCFACVGM